MKTQNETTTIKTMSLIWTLVPIKNRKKPAKIGICTNEWQPIETGSFLRWIVPYFKMPEVQIDMSNKKCSGETHCLNLQCPLNKTTFDSYCDFHNEPEWYRPKLKKKWSTLLKSLKNLDDFTEKCKQAYAKDPYISFIDFTEWH
jgi:hypothetical protein